MLKKMISLLLLPVALYGSGNRPNFSWRNTVHHMVSNDSKPKHRSFSLMLSGRNIPFDQITLILVIDDIGMPLRVTALEGKYSHYLSYLAARLSRHGFRHDSPNFYGAVCTNIGFSSGFISSHESYLKEAFASKLAGDVAKVMELRKASCNATPARASQQGS